MSSPEGEGPGPTELECYQAYRDRIANENLLIYHRLSWLLVGQSTMFSVWAIAFSRAEGHGPGRAGTAVLAGLGLAMCGVIYAGVLAALAAVEGLRREYETRHPAGRPYPGMPRLVGDLRTYRRGRLVPLFLPPLFMAGWIFVLLLTFVFQG